MEDKDILKLNKKSSFNDEDLFEILKKCKIDGEIKDDHPLALYMKEKGNSLNESRIKYSYTKSETVWKEFQKEKDQIYLFRITKKIDESVKDLIRNEFQIAKN